MGIASSYYHFHRTLTIQAYIISNIKLLLAWNCISFCCIYHARRLSTLWRPLEIFCKNNYNHDSYHNIYLHILFGFRSVSMTPTSISTSSLSYHHSSPSSPWSFSSSHQESISRLSPSPSNLWLSDSPCTSVTSRFSSSMCSHWLTSSSAPSHLIGRQEEAVSRIGCHIYIVL